MGWSLEAKAPWGVGRESIFDFLSARFDDAEGFGDDPPQLPDEVADPTTVSWSAGSFDGVSRHFARGKNDDATPTEVASAVSSLVARSTRRNAKRLYDRVQNADVLGFVDQVLEQLPLSVLPPSRVKAIGEWLATRAPDRSPIKFGIALMGVARPIDLQKLLILGSHDEFTLYATVAIRNAGGTDRDVWALAKLVHGWGRVEAVDRLADTNDPEIQNWLLRDGHRNAAMVEYVAMTCARAGHLAAALADANVDDPLVDVAGELIAAMLAGQPGPPISEYEDAAAVIDRYVRLIVQRRGSLRDRAVVRAIVRELEDGDDLAMPESLRPEILALSAEFAARPHFRGDIAADLRSPDVMRYWDAKTAANDLGIDTYDAVIYRIEHDLDQHSLWFDLLNSITPERLGGALELGRRHINLASIATGPSNAIGMGPGFGEHGNLGWFLQALPKFPGEGWDFVSTGLASPSIQNRNGAIKVLRTWPREAWPPDARSRLAQLIASEVSPRVKLYASDTLRGDVPLDEAWARTIEGLRERVAALVPLAQTMSTDHRTKGLRSEAEFSSFALWSGPYNSERSNQSWISITPAADAFNVSLFDRHRVTESREGLSIEDARGYANSLAEGLLSAPDQPLET